MTADNARLLFAAARGARIQRIYLKGGDWWMLAEYIGIRGLDGKQQRIHPADERLQYGPVSSQIRKAAENPPMFFSGIGDLAFAHVVEHYSDLEPGAHPTSKKGYGHVGDLHKSIFFLLLAESLADIGF